ncbi:hypothetical protein BaRGS_00017989 [Batillaria attramentaria]|uniref:Uncharacterized protein n=1 Tax=Batillaria attramentaria TaxID=370345 RepID=A0ABD0KUB1_9CAEN
MNSHEENASAVGVFDLQILNGLLDAASGSFTYVCHNGASVVDYFLVSDDLLGTSSVMTVGDCHVSRHFPLELSVKVGSPVHWEYGDVNDTARKECYGKVFWRNDQQDCLEEFGFCDGLETLMSDQTFDTNQVVDRISSRPSCRCRTF